MTDNPLGLQSIATIQPPTVPPAQKAPTRAQLKLIKRAELLKDQETGTPVFLPRFLVQCTLPHHDPGNVPIWQRHNNEFTLSLQPGYDGNGECIGYPYGLMPRLVLIWMVTEAKRTSSRRLSLGSSLTQFLTQLGLDVESRGKRSDAKRLTEQVRRLFNTRMLFHKRIQGNRAKNGRLHPLEGEAMQDRQIASSYELWWHAHSESLWESYVELGSDFFAAIMESTVPFRLEAVAMLRRSTLSLDMYILAVYLGYYLTLKGVKKHTLTWEMLNQQLGANYGDIDDLKGAVKKIVPRIKLAHPGLRMRVKQGQGGKNKKYVAGGLEIYASAPAIKPREPQQLEAQ